MERPLAIIFDRDGTLASVHNGPTKDFSKNSKEDKAQWAAFNAALPFDAVVPEIIALLRAVRPGVVRIMVSGRAEGDWPGDRRRKFMMEDWIAKYQLPIDHLFMRTGGDTRRDSIVKEEILLRDILPNWNPVVAVDDREEVCEVWRNYKIHVIKVTNPGELPPIGA